MWCLYVARSMAKCPLTTGVRISGGQLFEKRGSTESSHVDPDSSVQAREIVLSWYNEMLGGP